MIQNSNNMKETTFLSKKMTNHLLILKKIRKVSLMLFPMYLTN